MIISHTRWITHAFARCQLFDTMSRWLSLAVALLISQCTAQGVDGALHIPISDASLGVRISGFNKLLALELPLVVKSFQGVPPTQPPHCIFLLAAHQHHPLVSPSTLSSRLNLFLHSCCEIRGTQDLKICPSR